MDSQACQSAQSESQEGSAGNRGIGPENRKDVGWGRGYRTKYAYDDPANPALLHTVTEADRITTLTFDPVGRLRFEEVAEVGVTAKLTTEYRYDGDGELDVIVYPGGLAVKYVRDPVTKDVTEVKNAATQTRYASQVKHLPGGPVSDLTFATGETLSAGFTLRYEPVAISGGPLALSYVTTPGGNVGSVAALGFTYDTMGRLETSSPDWGWFGPMRYDYVAGVPREAWTADSTPKRRFAYHHDAGENLSGVSEYDPLSGYSIVRTTCFVHDALGRMVALGPARTTPASGQLACQSEADLSSVTVRFRYDAWSRRVARQDGTGPWKHHVATQQGQPLQELQRPATASGPWTLLRDYIWLEGRPIAQVEYPGPAGGGEGHVYAVHTDHLGQPLALTSRAGVQVWSSSLLRPYGETFETSVLDPASGRQVVCNLRLPGQYDERLGQYSGMQIYYNWHRWYVPSMGRYMDLDPIALAGGFNGPFGPDWYGYAEGNPLRYTDASGEAIWKVAYRIGKVALRYGRQLTRGQARARLMRGEDIATNSSKAMRTMGKDVSLAKGGPGKCVVEPGPTGSPHGHANRNASGTDRFPGHVFYDPQLALPWYLEVLDDNDDGTVDEYDVAEAINPLPVPIYPRPVIY